MCGSQEGGCGGCGSAAGLLAEAVKSALFPKGTLAVQTVVIPAPVGGNPSPVEVDWHVPFAAVAVNVVSSASGGAAVATSVTQAGGAATSAVLPAGSSVTGFDVDFQGPAAAVSGTVTVTGLSAAAGTTLSYDVTVPTSGLLLPVRFPNALAPLNAAATPQVNVPVLAAGPAYSATIYGLTAAVAAQPLTLVAGTAGGTAAPANGPGVAVIPAGKGGVFNLRGHSLTIWGGTPGDVVTLQAFTHPQPPSWG